MLRLAGGYSIKGGVCRCLCRCLLHPASTASRAAPALYPCLPPAPAALVRLTERPPRVALEGGPQRRCRPSHHQVEHCHLSHLPAPTAANGSLRVEEGAKGSGGRRRQPAATVPATKGMACRQIRQDLIVSLVRRQPQQRTRTQTEWVRDSARFESAPARGSRSAGPSVCGAPRPSPPSCASARSRLRHRKERRRRLCEKAV